jgi:hypothetical protein
VETGNRKRPGRDWKRREGRMDSGTVGQKTQTVFARDWDEIGSIQKDRVEKERRLLQGWIEMRGRL